MALKLQPTLTEMVSEVLASLNLGVQGEFNADLHPTIKRQLRVAQSFLWNRYKWLQNRTSVEIPLVEDVTVYDIPDGFEPGSFTRVFVRAAGDLVREWDLDVGISPEDRTAAGQTSTNPYNPVRYDIRDGVINVHPAPNSNPGTLVIEMESGLSPLTGDNDRPSVDGEACVQMATILMKEARRMPVGQLEKDTLATYIQDLRPKQSQGGVFTFGTEYVDPLDKPTGRKFYDDSDYWRGGP